MLGVVRYSAGIVDCSLICRVCQPVDDSSIHVASGFEQLAKRRCLIRHNLAATRVYWELYRQFEIKVTQIGMSIFHYHTQWLKQGLISFKV